MHSPWAGAQGLICSKCTPGRAGGDVDSIDRAYVWWPPAPPGAPPGPTCAASAANMPIAVPIGSKIGPESVEIRTNLVENCDPKLTEA